MLSKLAKDGFGTSGNWFRFSFIGFWGLQVWLTALVRNHSVSFVPYDVHILLYTMVGMVALVVALVFARSGRDGFKAQRLSAAFGSGAAMALAACFLCGIPFDLGEVAVLFGCAFGAIGYVSLLCLWLSFYSELGARDAFRYILIALVVDRLAFSVLSALPPEPVRIVLVFLPWYSVASFVVALKQEKPEKIRDIFYEPKDLLSFSRILLGILIYGLVLGMRKGVDLRVEDPMVNTLCQSASIVVLLLVYNWVIIRGRRLDFSRIVQSLLIVFSLIFVIHPFVEGAFLEAANALSVVVVGLISMLLVLAAVDVARHSSVHPFVVVGAIWAAYSLPRMIGASLSELILATSHNASDISLVMVFLIVISSAFLLGENPRGRKPIFADTSSLPDPEDFSSIESRCLALGHEKGLTPREIEVIQYLCKGRSKGYIAETLFISENTVRTHARNAYEKLSVHSRQELMSLIDIS